MAKAAFPQLKAEIKSVKDLEVSFRQTAELLNNIDNLDPDALKKQAISLNSALEKKLVSAGKQLVKGVRKEDLPKAMSAAYLFTRKYVEHCERFDSILRKKELDVDALGVELEAQFEDVYPFISTIEGVDSDLLKKLKGADVKALFRLLKETAKKVPGEASAGFNALVSSVEKLFPEEQGFALYSGLSSRIIGLGILYLIVWIIISMFIYTLIDTFYFEPVMGRIPAVMEQLQMKKVSDVISGILVLAFIFRKQLFGKKK